MRILVRLALSVVVALILAATLLPTGSSLLEREWVRCILCGGLGVSDFVANLLLFLPLGAALALLSWTARRTAVAAALLSTTIEFTQGFVPGRYSSLADIVLNTLGALLGVALVRSAPRWLIPSARSAGRLALAASLAAAGVVALSAYLLVPSLPRAPLFAQWTPTPSHLRPFGGRVVHAEVAGAALVPGPVVDRTPPGEASASDRLRARLLAGAPVRVRAVAGPPAPGLAPIVRVVNTDREEVLLVGAAGEDVVLRRRLRASDARLDFPDLRATGALRGVAPGAPLEIGVTREGRAHCIAVNGRTWCGLGFTAGSGWALLLYVDSAPAQVKALASALWLALLLLPAGFWMRRGPASAAAVVVAVAALALAPPVFGLLPTPPPQWVGAALGLLCGAALRRALSPRVAPAPHPPLSAPAPSPRPTSTVVG